MKENAIIIRPSDVIKTYVDYSNFDNIYQAINAKRVSTIHTIKTQELSANLGIHLMGYVSQDFDSKNNALACQISGYDYLGSPMFLCKTDDKFNPLPFDEAELECVYHYLTTGEVKSISSFKKDEAGQFAKEHGLNLVLPNFSIQPTVTKFDEYPNIILLTYDFTELSDSDYKDIGTELFNYSDILMKKFYNEDDAFVGPEENYCLKNKYDSANGKYYVAIQALKGRRDKPIVGDIDKFIGGEEEEEDPFNSFMNAVNQSSNNNEEEVDDNDPSSMFGQVLASDDSEYSEEAGDFDYDDEDEEEEEDSSGGEEEDPDEILDPELNNPDFLYPYVIQVELSATWPEQESTFIEYKYAYPLLQAVEKYDQPYFPYFKKLVRVTDFDYFGDTVDINVHLGTVKKVQLKLDEPVTFEFDYTPGKAPSHRVGKVTLTLRHYEFDFVSMPGTITIKEMLINEDKHKIIEKDIQTITDISNEDDADCAVDSELLCARYFPWLISEVDNLIIMYCGYDDYDNPDIRRKIYIPIKIGQKNITNDRSMSDDGYVSNIKTEISWEE